MAAKQVGYDIKEKLLMLAIDTLPIPVSGSEGCYLTEVLVRKGIENLAITDEASAREIVLKELEQIRRYA